MSSHFSSAIINSIPKKAAVYRHAKINGRTVRKPAPRVVFQPLAIKMDGSSKDFRPIITSFAPNIWEDIFSTSSVDHRVQQKYFEEIKALKKDISSMLMDATSTKLMRLIDAVERLGLAYHFEAEIADKLKQVYDSAHEQDYDLFDVAIRFRLLRQHQYHVSCNVFDKFVDKDNKLKLENLSSDVEGLLSLYEAAHFRIHDENVLEEAVVLTTHHLTRMVPKLEPSLKEAVQHALQFPLRKSVTIFHVRAHIDFYENQDSMDELLLRLAKLNFNFLQNIFRNELFEVTTWWNKLNLTSKVPYFRDRLIECYMWALAHNFEPHYSLMRTMMTKFYEMVTVMDDTYDNYATLEEIGHFTRALERWNLDEIDVLPGYFKVVYKFMINFGEEFEREAEKQGKSYVVPYYIEAVKQLGRGYAKEQKWIIEQQNVPNVEEYMIHSRITTLMYVVSAALAPFIKSGTKEIIDRVVSDSELIVIIACEVIRIKDDIFTYEELQSNLSSLIDQSNHVADMHNFIVDLKRESKDGTLHTCIEYYMKDNHGTSMQEAKNAIKELLENKWKDMNAEWVNCNNTTPNELAMAFINLAGMCEIIYMKGEDNFTYPEKNHMTPMIRALFLDPILI